MCPPFWERDAESAVHDARPQRLDHSTGGYLLRPFLISTEGRATIPDQIGPRFQESFAETTRGVRLRWQKTRWGHSSMDPAHSVLPAQFDLGHEAAELIKIAEGDLPIVARDQDPPV